MSGHADENYAVLDTNTSFIEQAKTLTIAGGVAGGVLLEIDLETGKVTAHDSLSATEAGKVFVEYVRNYMKPCGTVKIE